MRPAASGQRCARRPTPPARARSASSPATATRLRRAPPRRPSAGGRRRQRRRQGRRRPARRRPTPAIHAAGAPRPGGRDLATAPSADDGDSRRAALAEALTVAPPPPAATAPTSAPHRDDRSAGIQLAAGHLGHAARRAAGRDADRGGRRARQPVGRAARGRRSRRSRADRRPTRATAAARRSWSSSPGARPRHAAARSPTWASSPGRRIASWPAAGASAVCAGAGAATCGRSCRSMIGARRSRPSSTARATHARRRAGSPARLGLRPAAAERRRTASAAPMPPVEPPPVRVGSPRPARRRRRRGRAASAPTSSPARCWPPTGAGCSRCTSTAGRRTWRGGRPIPAASSRSTACG